MKKIILVLMLGVVSNVAHAGIVAEVIAAEACGEGQQGMQAVGNVIANRAKKWNITPEQVVTQKNQFDGLNHPRRARLYEQCKSTADSIEHSLLWARDITGGALYFQTHALPKRRWHGELTVKIGGHSFYREAGR